jgi:hypothetical protein
VECLCILQPSNSAGVQKLKAPPFPTGPLEAKCSVGQNSNLSTQLTAKHAGQSNQAGAKQAKRAGLRNSAELEVTA